MPLTANRGLIESVRTRLVENAQPERAAPMQAYMKSEMPYLGVPMPACRKIWRSGFDVSLDQREWWATVEALWDEAEYREERYAAIGLARHRRFADFQHPDLIEGYGRLISDGAWWDLVDEIASHLVGDLLRKHAEVITPVLDQWAVVGDLWRRRTAIISQIGSKELTDTALLTRTICANLDGSVGRAPAMSTYGREFFIRKAIGWALRSYAYTDADWVRRFVDQHRESLSGLSIREATKHLG